MNQTQDMPPEESPRERTPFWGRTLASCILPGLGVVALDQLTKHIVRDRLPLNRSVEIISGWFSLSHISNTGVVFGLFPGKTGLFTVLSVAAIALLLYLAFSMDHGRKSQLIAFSLLLGGACGNLIDRLFLGHVTDFFDFHFWPAFNVADAFICIGVGLFVFTNLTRHTQESSDASDHS